MKKIILFLLLFVTLRVEAEQPTEIKVIPFPNSVIYSEGICRLPEPLTISFPNDLESEFPIYIRLFNENDIRLQKKGKGILRFIKTDGLAEEEYQLTITPKEIKIKYTSPAGAFHAVQTLKQLLNKEEIPATLPCLEIKDKPAFPHRAFMLDEGREFKGKTEVKKILDEMARMKMNVFHWHLCEERGWRIEIKKYPLLTKIGSKMRHAEPYEQSTTQWDEKHPEPWFYTQEEITEIVKYAAKLHIQIMPEIEIPGHSGASIMAYPWLGCASSKKGEHIRGDIYQVTDPKVEQFFKDVIDELTTLFPMKVLHIGGDEAAYWSWEQDPEVMDFIKTHDLHNPAGLQVWFINRINQYLNSKGWTLMGWNEITGDDLRGEHEAAQVRLDTTAIVQFWDGDVQLIEKSLKNGYRVVNSNRFFTYLDYPEEVTPLEKCYSFSIIPEGLTPELNKKMIGLGAQMWGEQMPTVDAMYKRIYPRIAAMAECGWTLPENKNFSRFNQNLPVLTNIWEQKGYYNP